MADSIVKQILQFEAALTSESRATVKKQIEEIFTSAKTDIAIDTNAAKKNFTAIATMMNNIFKSAGFPVIDIHKMLNEQEVHSAFTTLGQIASQDFIKAWSKTQTGMPSLNQTFIRERSDLSSAYHRMSVGGKEAKTVTARQIDQALQLPTNRNRTNINTLLSELVANKDIITNGSYSWEAQDVARLNYVKLRDQIMSRTEGGFDLSGITAEYIDVFKQIDQIGEHTIAQLRAAIPAIETSLQNIFTLAAGKVPLNLTKGGVYDAAQSPQRISELNTWGLVGERGKLAQPVANNIYEGINNSGGEAVLTAKEVTKAFEELRRLSTDPSQIQTAEQLNDIYEERARIIREIGASNLQTADPEQYKQEEGLNNRYKTALQQKRQEEADVMAYSQISQTLGYNKDLKDIGALEKLLAERQAAMSNIHNKEAETYKQFEKENQQISEQISLLQQATQASQALEQQQMQTANQEAQQAMINKLNASIANLKTQRTQLGLNSGDDISAEKLNEMSVQQQEKMLQEAKRTYGQAQQSGKQEDLDVAIAKWQKIYDILQKINFDKQKLNEFKPTFSEDEYIRAQEAITARFRKINQDIRLRTSQINSVKSGELSGTKTSQMLTDTKAEVKTKTQPKTTAKEVTQESKDLQDVQKQVEAITSAVSLKTDAFRNEGVEVARIVTEEIAELTKLEDIVNRIAEKVNAIVAGIGSIQISEPKLDNAQKEASRQQVQSETASFKRLQSLERQYGRYSLKESATFGSEQQRARYEKQLLEDQIAKARSNLDLSPEQENELTKARNEGNERARLAEIQKLESEVQKLGKLEAEADNKFLMSSRKKAQALAQQIEQRKQALNLSAQENSALEASRRLAYDRAAEPLVKKEEEKTMRSLVALYERLGNLRTKALVSNDANLQQQIVTTEQQIQDAESGYPFTQTDRNALIQAEQRGGDVARQKELNQLKTESVRLGKLEGQQRLQNLSSRKEEVQSLKDTIKQKINSLNLVKAERAEIAQIIVSERQRVVEASNIKTQQKAARLNKSISLVDKAKDVQQNLVNSDVAGADTYATDLQAKIENLESIIARIQSNAQDANYDDLRTQTVNMTRQLEQTSQFIRLSGPNTEMMGGQSMKDVTNTRVIENTLKEQVSAYTNGAAKIKSFDAATGQLSYTMKEAGGYVASYTAEVRALDGQMVATRGAVTKTEGIFATAMRKMKEFGSYFTGSTLIYRAVSVIRDGVTYVKEIDSALTELKKVTNETTETYDKFLETASRTASKVGSTIKDITSSAADWARLGYSISEATELAETTQVLMNVSEFTDVSTATDSLISSIQAFKYTAEESMDVVDILNTIGNNYAISTADLATSLTKSSGSLVAANGTLEEAVALTATAM